MKKSKVSEHKDRAVVVVTEDTGNVYIFDSVETAIAKAHNFNLPGSEDNHFDKWINGVLLGDADNSYGSGVLFYYMDEYENVRNRNPFEEDMIFMTFPEDESVMVFQNIDTLGDYLRNTFPGRKGLDKLLRDDDGEGWEIALDNDVTVEVDTLKSMESQLGGMWAEFVKCTSSALNGGKITKDIGFFNNDSGGLSTFDIHRNVTKVTYNGISTDIVLYSNILMASICEGEPIVALTHHLSMVDRKIYTWS